MKIFTYFWRKGLWAALSLLFIVFIIASVAYLYLASQLPDVDSLKQVQLQVPLRIYTADKQLLAEYGEKRRIPVPYAQVPPQLVNAILATEDQRFFEHPGVDIYGLVRAALRLVRTRTKSQGGSTITMQVARNFFLSRNKTFLRKFNEILLAIKIDKELPKEKILELYLNKIYLGNRAYGVAAAAAVYYGRALNELSIAQIAMLAGLPQAPSSQNPLANPKAAKKRRNHVLERMLEENFIDQSAYQTAIAEPLTARYHGRKITVSAPYVAEMIRQALYKHFGKATYTKGYKVYTTINGHNQKAANDALENNLLAYDKRHGYRGPLMTIDLSSLDEDNHWSKQLKNHQSVNDLVLALVTNVNQSGATAKLKNGANIDLPWKGIAWARPALRKGYVGRKPKQVSDVLHPGDVIYVRQLADKQWQLSQLPMVEGALISLDPCNGAIQALTGGFNFQRSKFNRVTQASRQPGSSFKPFIYAAALDKGMTLATLINDAPVVVDDPSQENLWRPQNDTRKFYGPTRLRIGLTRSRNLVSIRILENIGIPYTLEYLQKFGFELSSLPNTLSLALGSLSLSPLQLASAYTVFANGGYKTEPYLINKITNSRGQVVLQANPQVACDKMNNKALSHTQRAQRVISQQTAYLMTSALQDVIQHGTGRGAKVLKRHDLAGKTGTTNDQMDAWFSGFNRDLVTTVWIGFDRPISLREYAARTALPTWIDYMRVALHDKPEHSMIAPSDLITVRIDPKTGLLASPSQTQAIFEVFRQKNVPTQYANTASTVPRAEDDHEKVLEHLF